MHRPIPPRNVTFPDSSGIFTKMVTVGITPRLLSHVTCGQFTHEPVEGFQGLERQAWLEDAMQRGRYISRSLSLLIAASGALKVGVLPEVEGSGGMPGCAGMRAWTGCPVMPDREGRGAVATSADWMTWH